MNKILSRRLAMFAAAVAVTTLAACASTRTSEGTGEYVDDTVITAKVKALVLNEPSLKSAEINVETFKGRVQLSGFVSSRAEMEKAESVARGVKGVSSVANDMRVK
jgi:osmotically-inducible protein OsmY